MGLKLNQLLFWEWLYVLNLCDLGIMQPLNDWKICSGHIRLGNIFNESASYSDKNQHFYKEIDYVYNYKIKLSKWVTTRITYAPRPNFAYSMDSWKHFLHISIFFSTFYIASIMCGICSQITVSADYLCISNFCNKAISNEWKNHLCNIFFSFLQKLTYILSHCKIQELFILVLNSYLYVGGEFCHLSHRNLNLYYCSNTIFYILTLLDRKSVV